MRLWRGDARFLEESEHVKGEFFDPKVAEPFENHRYVRRNGSHYRLSLQLGGIIAASYLIRATMQEPPDNATVVAIEALSSESREAVRRGIGNGTYYVSLGKWDSLPDDLDGVEYVRQAEEHYRIDITVGDARALVLTAEKVV